MPDRISSLDASYAVGDLSVYPQAIDTKETLYEARNNAESTLAQSLGYTSTVMLVTDTGTFPDAGIVLVGEELIYYSSKGTGILKGLVRGFEGSLRNKWSAGTKVSCSVMAEHHNAIKDAIYNIEHFVGLSNNPDPASLNGRLTAFEQKILAPQPLFRAYPLAGLPPLSVTFHNFSNRQAVRFLWDFGDGAVSSETNPIHTYLSDGKYTVQLQMVTELGGQGSITKNNYIVVSSDKGPGFMYVTPLAGTTTTTFNFVDQTDGNIIRRYWVFDDGTNFTQNDPNIHSIDHIYTSAGTYNPTLLVEFADQTLERVLLSDPIVVVNS